MKTTACLRDEHIFLYLNTDMNKPTQQVGYPLGSNIIAFIRIDCKPIVMQIFTEYINLAFNVDYTLTGEQFFNHHHKIMNTVIIRTPFLYFPFKALHSCIMKYFSGEVFNEEMLKVPNFEFFRSGLSQSFEANRELLFSQFKSAVSKEVFIKLNETELNQEFDRYILFLCLRDTIIYNLEQSRKTMTEEVNFLYDNKEKLNIDNLTPTQKLYIYDYHRSSSTGKPLFYINSNFNIRIVPVEKNQVAKTEKKTIEEIVDFVKTNNVDLTEMYEINDYDELIKFELLKLIESNITVNKCENCGNFFIPKGRKDMKYCNTIIAGTTKKCSDVGSNIKQSKQSKENPIDRAYSKAYKRNYSKQRTGRIGKLDFFNWSELAVKNRNLCHSGEMSFEDFVAFTEVDVLVVKRGTL